MARIQIKNLEFQSKNGDIYGFDAVSKSDLDEFDPEAHKNELNTIADGVKSKMAVFDSLTELDLDELKAQIEAEILAELNGAGA